MQEEIAYAPKRAAVSRFVDLRGMRHHVLTWGDRSGPALVLLHGWMDVGASFQFLVDAFERDWHVIAPDLRGFGRSEWQPQGYWFYDYLADLEALLDVFSPDAAVDLAGHSLGANVVLHYAGVRPARVRRVVALDGFGIPDDTADAAVRKSRRWLDALDQPVDWKPFADLGAVADRLQKTNPRLPRDKALFLARHWADVQPDGTARLNSDPRHKLPFPTVYRMAEVVALWRAIEAQVLWIAARQSHLPAWLDPAHNPPGAPADFTGVRERVAHVRHARFEIVDDASHMLHHDQPHAVARLIEPFLAAQ